MAIWRGRDVYVLMTSTSTNSADSFTSGTDFAGYFKSVEFKEPERSTGEQKLLGSTGGNANSETWEEDPSLAEMSGELILSPKPSDNTEIDSMFFTYTSSGGVYMSNYAQDPKSPSVFIRFGTDAAYVGFVLQDVTLNSLGGVKTEAGGQATRELKVSCAANKCWKVKKGFGS
jgi:hypothetical protein